MSRLFLLTLLAIDAVPLCGCRSPYYQDRGAIFGGLTGAGVGAVVGNAAGNTGAGAVIGSALGAITGSAVGESIDADLARTRAEIEARMGRQMQGAVTPQDVIAMTQAGLSDDVIITHIRANGVAQPLAVNDLIGLRNMGVRDSVINAMQQGPPPPGAYAKPWVSPAGYTVYPAYPPSGVLIEHHYTPWCPPPFVGYHHLRPRSRISWGFSVCP